MGVNKTKLAIVVFSSSRDIYFRRLIPALYLLYKHKKLEKEFNEFAIFTYARTQFELTQEKKEIEEALKIHLGKEFNKHTWINFSKSIFYTSVYFHNEADYLLIKQDLMKFSSDKIIFYFATSTIDSFGILDNLEKSKIIFLKKASTNSLALPKISVVFDKPFGNDFKSANALNKSLKKYFNENQIFRLDHYLGKLALQNIIALKNADGFDALFNKHCLDHIQIILDESEGIDERGLYYDKTGAIKDVFQNHLLQFLAILLMDIPRSKIKNQKSKSSLDKCAIFEKNFLKNKEAILSQIEFSKSTLVFGQYDKNKGANPFKKMNSYRQEKNVAPYSMTETFFAAKLKLKNHKLNNVPIYVRTGKRLENKLSKAIIFFKKDSKCLVDSKAQDRFIKISLHPFEGIEFVLDKTHDKHLVNSLNCVDFFRQDSIALQMQQAYANLIEKILEQDHLFFVSAKESELAWKLVDKILKEKKNQEKETKKLFFPNYFSKTCGPKEAEELIRRDKRKWFI